MGSFPGWGASRLASLLQESCIPYCQVLETRGRPSAWWCRCGRSRWRGGRSIFLGNRSGVAATGARFFFSALHLKRRRWLRQSGAGKRGHQACVKSAALPGIGRVPHHRLGLAAEPAPEVVFRRGPLPHSGNVAGDLVGHRGYVVPPPTGGDSLGVVAGHDSHAHDSAARAVRRRCPILR